jgi:AcrR family transcriptional regulator
MAPVSPSGAVVERSIAGVRQRAESEVACLVDAGLTVLGRAGGAGLTVAAVLEESGLATRAFYRHFASKDELLLAVYERDAVASMERMRERLRAANGPRAALDEWIDETLSLGFDTRRADRTRTLAAEGAWLRHELPSEFAAIHDGLLTPLRDVLADGRARGVFPHAQPAADARSIHAVTWALVEARLAGAPRPGRRGARAQVLRFCLPALGATDDS